MHPWRNWIAHRSSEPRVSGSNPDGCIWGLGFSGNLRSPKQTGIKSGPSWSENPRNLLSGTSQKSPLLKRSEVVCGPLELPAPTFFLCFTLSPRITPPPGGYIIELAFFAGEVRFFLGGCGIISIRNLLVHCSPQPEKRLNSSSKRLRPTLTA